MNELRLKVKKSRVARFYGWLQKVAFRLSYKVSPKFAGLEIWAHNKKRKRMGLEPY